MRCCALDGERLLTGDTEGYVFAWDLRNCLDPAAGPDKLCLRAHNAMDPNVYCKDSEKIVYGVHLEQAVMIQVQQKQQDDPSQTDAGCRLHRPGGGQRLLGLRHLRHLPAGVVRARPAGTVITSTVYIIQ